MRTVFVSSTSKGMDAIRRAVCDAVLLKDGFTPSAMENFGMRPAVPLEICLRKVRESQVFLGIIGVDYGSCPLDNATSYTQHEYEEAVRLGLPRLMFVTPDTEDIDPRQVAFRATVLRDNTAKLLEIANPDKFATFTVAGLANLPPEASGDSLSTTIQPDLPPLPPLVGRDSELLSIAIALTSAENPISVAVIGHAGIGKTSLTLAVLHNAKVVERYGNRRFFVRLETADTAEAMRAMIVAGVGLNPAQAKFADALAFLPEHGRALIVLDNLETPWIAEPQAVEEDLQRLSQVAGLTLLASLRGTDRPDSVDWLQMEPLAPLARADARRLFLRIAHRVKQDDPHLDPLIDALGGLPLAITLVARQAAPGTSLKLVWEEYQRIGADLACDPRARGKPTGRLAALTASIELSLAHTEMPARRLFGLLGQTPAGMSDEDLVSLLGEEALPAVRQLQAVGLAQEWPGRIDLLPPVRDHARRHHQAVGDDARWFRHYLSLAEEHTPKFTSDRGAEALNRLAPELPNIEASIRDAIACGEVPIAIKSLEGFGRTLINSGQGSPFVLEELAQACAAGGDIANEARCVTWGGHVAYFRSLFDDANSHFLRARDLFRRSGQRRGEAQCVQRLGDIANTCMDYVTAGTHFKEALELYRSEGATRGEAWCLYSLGSVAYYRSDYDTSRSHTDAALLLYRQIDDLEGDANCTLQLGKIEARNSKSANALALYDKALSLYGRIGDPLGEANCYCCLGDVARENADEQRAVKYYDQALATYQRVHDNLSAGWIHLRLARRTPEGEREYHLAAARKAWLAVGLIQLAERLRDPASIDDLEF